MLTGTGHQSAWPRAIAMHRPPPRAIATAETIVMHRPPPNGMSAAAAAARAYSQWPPRRESFAQCAQCASVHVSTHVSMHIDSTCDERDSEPAHGVGQHSLKEPAKDHSSRGLSPTRTENRFAGMSEAHLALFSMGVVWRPCCSDNAFANVSCRSQRIPKWTGPCPSKRSCG